METCNQNQTQCVNASQMQLNTTQNQTLHVIQCTTAQHELQTQQNQAQVQTHPHVHTQDANTHGYGHDEVRNNHTMCKFQQQQYKINGNNPNLSFAMKCGHPFPITLILLMNV